MILYVDTSAFVKLYVEEQGSAILRGAVAESLLHTHWITYPEMRAALARLHRMGYQTEDEYRQHKLEFETDWKAVNTILPDERILRRAGELAERFGLRGYDSVHLAAAESLRVGPGADLLSFASFDAHLNQSAEELGLRLMT